MSTFTDEQRFLQAWNPTPLCPQFGMPLIVTVNWNQWSGLSSDSRRATHPHRNGKAARTNFHPAKRPWVEIEQFDKRCKTDMCKIFSNFESRHSYMLAPQIRGIFKKRSIPPSTTVFNSNLSDK